VVKKNELIVRVGKKVTPRQERILDEMAEVMRSEAAGKGIFVSAAPAAARVLLTLGAFAFLFIYLHLFRREMFNSNNRLLALLIVFAMQLIFIQLAVGINMPNYAFPVAMLAIIATVLFDTEIGLISTFVLAMLLGVMHRFDFTLALMTVVLGTVSSLISGHTRKRTHFFRIFIVIVFTTMFFIVLVEGMKLTPDRDFTTLLGLGAFAASLSVIFSIFFIPFFESLFGITTDLTLLELSDLNHPLLKRLALEAPGTYHHSISVGNLCEAAAKEIGGNPLLARVGAYFHDIGKIEIPEYFVENQLSVKSRHEQLTPTMSALILSSHVKRGRQLGEKEDIPDDVLNFIEEHHGTMVQTYFYNKAVEQGGDPKDVDKFRYPGPKPQVRETGICMLADAVEAASRTLDDPKPSRINNLIQRIINDRFQSGELNECPLTLRDLAKIKEAFAQVLIAAFHHRIEYPKRKEAIAEVS
jgi:putative nucleotidyltransferase with HDIG domain